jgi:septal ring factor EnvC (AmiA/AmiB activator)
MQVGGPERKLVYIYEDEVEQLRLDCTRFSSDLTAARQEIETLNGAMDVLRTGIKAYCDSENEAVDKLKVAQAEIEALKARVKELEESEVEDLKGIICQSGHLEDDGSYDSMALSHVADAMCRLADLGHFEVIGERSRRMFGKFKDDPPGSGKGEG